jgi:hypothetical protein
MSIMKATNSEIEQLVYDTTNESNKQTIAMINGMLSLIQEHLDVLVNSEHITAISFKAETKTLAITRKKFAKGFEKFQFTFVAFGPNKEFTLADVANLLKLTNSESETSILNELKIAVETQMIFYGSFVQCTYDLNSVWDELTQEFCHPDRSGVWNLKYYPRMQSITLTDLNLNLFKVRYMWLEWSKFATAFVKYFINECKYAKDN